MDKNQKLEVAQAIRDQFGGQRFVAFTGAKNFFAIEREGKPGLQFSIPYNAGAKINRVIVLLQPNDTYSVEFGRVWGSKYEIISFHEEVYAIELITLFEQKTKLITKL